MKKKESSGKKAPPAARKQQQKIFGGNSLQVSENDGGVSSTLVGGIVEKGFSQNTPLAPSSVPRSTVLPFPVARHRSHGPHWAPKGSDLNDVCNDDEDDGEDGKFIAAFANPVQRKQKKGLDFSRWQELITDSPSGPPNKTNSKLLAKPQQINKVSEATGIQEKINSHIGVENAVQLPRRSPGNDAKEQDANIEVMDPEVVKEQEQVISDMDIDGMPNNLRNDDHLSQDAKYTTLAENCSPLKNVSQKRFEEAEKEILGSTRPGYFELSRKQTEADVNKHYMSESLITSNLGYNNLRNEQGATNLGSQIDAENRARLERMSAGEIAEAQAELMKKMNPALLEMLKKQGQNKLKKQECTTPDIGTSDPVGNLQDEIFLTNKSTPFQSDISHKVKIPDSTQTGVDDNLVQKNNPSSSSWETWSKRVEAVRELRFSLEGNVIESDIVQVPKADVEMMKERFAKLLLGEDMSGGGKGVCAALAISNAITNLSATVFGELWRLEPLAPQKKSVWCREMECLLCVSDSIVELVPSIQQFSGGGTYEVMATRPRSDLYITLPALKKLDAMLINILEGFRDLEFCYVDRGIVVADGDDHDAYTSAVSGGRPSVRQEEKWWLPCPKVPSKGLSEVARKKLQQCRDCTNQIWKAALAINSNVLAEMEIPIAYLDTLPKNGKACLGDIIYRYITADQFSLECLLDCLDLSSEHYTLEVADRIEAAVHVWKLKDQKKNTNHSKAKRSSWSGKVKGLVADGEKNHLLAKRAENLLHSLRLRFPGLPQTALDMNKIQYNKDVGQSILESYSRVLESLAFNIMARIDDVLYVDDAAKRCAAAESMPFFSRGGLGGPPIQKRMLPSPFSIQHTPYTSPFATPTFCSSPPIIGSPGREPMPIQMNGLKGVPGHKLEIPMPADLEKLWSYSGNLSGRKISGDPPERD